MFNMDFRSEEESVNSKYILRSQHRSRVPLEIPDVSTLPDLFKWQAQRRGAATLFSFRDYPEARLTTVSYARAYETSTKLARALRSLHQKASPVRPVVGIWLEKSIELHLAILATTISGATWLPFDADAPASRLTACLKDSNSCFLLCDAAHYTRALEAVKDTPNTQVLTFDELSGMAQNQRGPQIELSGPNPSDAAYMIYTSGSTGTPKGIEIPQSAALTFCLSECSVLETGPKDIVWQGFSPAFDMFIEEVWVSIAGGAQLAIGSRAECQDVPGLGGAAGVWAERGVTLVNAVPTLINIMTSLDDECSLPSSIRLLNLGGEACPSALVKRLWHSGLRIINTYGPSETTVTATFQELFPDEQVTIGKPLPMYHALLLPISDEVQLSPSPIVLEEGAEGELAIGGKCLGNGYVGRPTLTREKFIQHPLPTVEGERLYRTGDRVRLDKNFNIVFLGRIDTQVKHRGFRIELGEIENSIAAHPRVQAAAVILSTVTDCLEAYIVVKDGEAIEIKEVRAKLEALPAYMKPEGYFFISANEMPRLPSGKINAKALQDVSARFAAEKKASGADTNEEGNAYSIPDDGSELSLLLQGMVAVFPQAGAITPTSDFFDDLGGHSLAAATLVSKLRKGSPEGSALRRLTLKDIYTFRTAERIAQSLVEDSSDAETLNEKDKDGQDSQGHGKTSGPRMGDHWPVSRWKYVLCGIAQIPALLFLFFMQAVGYFVPYLVFHFVLLASNVGYAILATYLTFVVTPGVMAIIGIIGKWIVIGKAKEGEYPLYGLYYYRWWLAQHFIALISFATIADTPLIPSVMRLVGAKIGTHCHISATSIGAAFDLVTIGDDVVLGKSTVLATSWVERGRLILAPVTIESQTHIGSNTVLEGNSCVKEGAELTAMTMLPSGVTVPAGERWHGSPARFLSHSQDVGNMRATRPSRIRIFAMLLATSLTSIFILPILSFAPQVPSIILLEYVAIPGLSIWAQMAVVAVPASLAYLLLVFLTLFILRWVVLGVVHEGSFRTTSVYYYRKWFVDRLMDMSLVILHPVYASLYVVPFLRSLGVKIGRRAEVSTARGINFELTEIGDESFVADGVLIGDDEIRGNMVTMKKTKLNARAFAGNASLVPQGIELASNTLVGVLSIAPLVPLKEGQSSFGSPPVLMPARQRVATELSDSVLYSPSWYLIITRLFIEGMRIILPRFLIVLGLGYGVQIFEMAAPQIRVVSTVFLLPFFFFFFFAIPALVFTILLKWILIGRYHTAEWPLWSVSVWKSEFVTSMYESLAGPIVVDLLVGTPFLAWVLRLLGVQVGSLTTLLSHDITEFDMVSLGDEAVINQHAGPQTHLFEDRIMKVGRIDIEKRGCMKTYSVCLPHSSIGENAQLGALSLVMKGETVPANEAWEGAPIAPRRKQIRHKFSETTIQVLESDSEEGRPSKKLTLGPFLE